MLIGIDSLLTPDLLHALASMGHGDTIALVDANYPATRSRRLVNLPGADVARVLRAVLSVMPLDAAVPAPAQIMLPADGTIPGPVAEMNVVLAGSGAAPATELGRPEFFAAAEQAYAVVATGELRFYGNILLTKGSIAPAAGGGAAKGL
jgi:L-fucose mutarotase